jgi:two-component system, NtrC family, response regulator AtoC
VPPLILIVEDEKILADSMALYLERHAYATAVAYAGEESLQLAEENSPDVMVVDMQLPGIDGLEVLRRIREASPSTEVVMITAYASIATAVEAMKRGAFDYLSKPVDLDELCVVVNKALTHARMRRELSYLKARSEVGGHLSAIVGESVCIQALREQIAHIATLEAPGSGAAPTVLILGETGVGKELVAHAIHYQSPRAAGPFVEINCAAIPAPLLEAEVFGYEKGAYTDAKTAKPGLFEAAEGGTLFLDEIGHMELALQVKLLKVIEEKAVRRLGGLRSKTIKARIIAATNRDLEAAIAEGAFRADLYYRINVLTVQVPPLRVRGADITLLAQHFLEFFARQYARPLKTLAPEAEALLHTYPWPGNVRELAHVMERAIFLPGGPCVQAADLDLARAKATSPVVIGSGGNVHVDFSSGGISLDDVERQLIVAALQVTAWNRTRAARLLGLSKETLRYRMEKYQLRPLA